MIAKHLLAVILVIAATVTARADADFITHRYDSFTACNVNNESVVFIGNSITNMGNWHEHFGDDSRFLNRGNSGACSYEALENLESILIGHPAKIFVMIGTNDIGTQTGTPETIALNARALIDRVANESPETKLHIVSTFPSTNGYRTLENHSEINRRLRQVCDETQTTFIDLWDQMMGIVDNSISADRLHVTIKGYYIWSNALVPYIGDTACTLPATTEANNTYNWTNGNGLRVNMIASLPIKADDVLMIGGEMFNNGEWHELLGNPHVKIRAATYGYGDYFSADWVTFLGYIFDLNKSIKECPSQIYLNIGSQDIDKNVALATLKANYRNCVDIVRQKAPGARLVLTALTPHTDATKNNLTKEFNTYISELATELGLDFVDLFAATSNADGTPDPRYITTGLNAPYVSGRGYLQLARTLAPTIGNCTVEADADFMSRHAMIEARRKLGNVISASFTTVSGETTGMVSPAAVKALVDARDEIYALLNNAEATAEQLNAAYEQNGYRNLLDACAELNQPTSGNYYHIVSRRGNRMVHMATATSLASSPVADTDAHLSSSVWEFIQRGDGSWDIVNRKHGKYLTPSARVSANAPASGWHLRTHNNPGTYALVSGTDQFHQLNDGNLTSWGNGSNISDEGCAFYINELADDYDIYDEPRPIVTVPEESTEDRVIEYTLTSVRGNMKASEAATGNWILGTATGSDYSTWILHKRDDGTFDIKNKATGNYIDGANTNSSTSDQFMSSSEVPSEGWTFREVPGTTDDVFIITSGTNVQFHQAKPEMQSRIINWGYGSKNPGEFRFDDEGCRFTLAGKVVKDVQSGISEIATEAPAAPAAVFDLTGRRVSVPARGIYIVNGKKTVVR